MTATKAKLASTTASDSAATKYLILVVNQKGGVGKSVVTRALADFFRGMNKPAHFYDTDGGTGSFLLSYGTRDEKGILQKDQDPAKGVGYFDIRSDKSRNALFDNLQSGAKWIVCDMAGGSLGEISKIVDDGEGLDGFTAAVAEYGYKIIILNVVSNVRGATSSVAEYMKAFGDNAQQIAVINKAWGKSEEDFPFWYGFTSKTGEKKGGITRDAFLAAGGKEIHFPAMANGTFAKVDALQKPFAASTDDADLTPTETQHVKKFNREAQAAFLEISEVLGL